MSSSAGRKSGRSRRGTRHEMDHRERHGGRRQHHADRFARRLAFADLPGSEPGREARYDVHGVRDAAGCGEARDTRAQLARRGERTPDALRGRARRARIDRGVRRRRGGAKPALTWKGCVPMPEGLAANSVASFADGGLVATVLLMPGKTFADSVAKQADWRRVRMGARQAQLRADPRQRAAGQQRHRGVRRRQGDLRRVVRLSNDRRIRAPESDEAAAHDATAAVYARQRPHGPRRQAAHRRHEERRARVRRGAGTAALDLAKLSTCPRGFIAMSRSIRRR